MGKEGQLSDPVTRMWHQVFVLFSFHVGGAFADAAPLSTGVLAVADKRSNVPEHSLAMPARSASYPANSMPETRRFLLLEGEIISTPQLSRCMWIKKKRYRYILDLQQKLARYEAGEGGQGDEANGCGTPGSVDAGGELDRPYDDCMRQTAFGLCQSRSSMRVSSS